MSHLAAFKQQLHQVLDDAGRRADIRRLEKRVARLTAESERAAAARAALPAGSSRARVTTANARWARKAEARDAAIRELEALKVEKPWTSTKTRTQ